MPIRAIIAKLSGKKSEKETRKKDGLLNDTQRVEADRKLIKICAILAVALGALNYQAIEDMKKESKTVLVPFGVRAGDMWVSGTDASNSYLRRVADLIIANYKNVSASSVSYKYADLLTLTDSSTSGVLRTKLMDKAADVKLYPSISYSAELIYDKPLEVKAVLPETLAKALQSAKDPYLMTIPVSAYRHVGDQRQPGKTISIKVYYAIKNGQFSLLDIEG